MAQKTVMTLLKIVLSHHKGTKDTKTELTLTHKDDSLENVIFFVISVSPW